jgi:cell division protein FtsI (penicillin-binding protein 3)
VAATVRELLAGVVERGTAVDADLAMYSLAGKTGTPRRAVDGRYAPMQYNPNFVGLFPADAPQLVVVVKLSNPKGDFYGGRTAAPMTKTVLEAALAARDAALDRSALKMRVSAGPSAIQAGRARTAVATVRRASPAPVEQDTTAGSVLLHLPPTPERTRVTAASRRVPNVHGMSLRDAVRSLHSAGFRVQLVRDASPSNQTEPPTGVTATAGSLVRLRYSR